MSVDELAKSMASAHVPCDDPGMTRIRTLVIEDDDLMRAGICSGLMLQGIDVVGAAADASTGLRMARAAEPDAAVIDLNLGAGPNGIDLAIALRAVDASIGLTLLTSYQHPRLAGASAESLPSNTRYCVKQSLTDMSQLARVVRTSVVVDDSVLSLPELSPLTADQVDVLRMIAQGMTNAQIAEARSISDKAVEYAVRKLAQALDVPTDGAGNSRVLLTRRYFAMIGGAGAE